MRLLVTRAEEDGKRTAERLERLGHSAVLCPAIDIVAIANPVLPTVRFSGIIATSRHALIAASDLPGFERLRRLPVHVVGRGAAETAGSVGFSEIASIASTAGDLINGLRREPKTTSLLYLRGKDVSRNLAAELGKSGLRIEEAVVYEARPRQSIAAEILSMISRRTIDGVLFYSAATARAFMAMIAAKGLASSFGEAAALCLSDEVAGCLPDGVFAVRRVAPRPGEDGMLALLPRGGAALDEERSGRTGR